MFFKVLAFTTIALFCQISANVLRHDKNFSKEPIMVDAAEIPVDDVEIYEHTNRRKYVESGDLDNYEKDADYFAHPKYNYKYGVDDKHTGDKKFHYEERDGDVVRGQYKVLDADGNIRIVDYTADKINGFNPIVSRKEYHPSA